jgi:flagellar hook-basal body complex protein FliE
VITTPAINRSGIEAMLERMKSVSANLKAPAVGTAAQSGASAVSFGDIFKSSLEQVSAMQGRAEGLSQAFAKGDQSVNLSDMMMATQKANIAFQATVQVRNKLVSAYHDIISMAI